MAKTKLPDFQYGEKAKKYYLADGQCVDCTLDQNCRDNMAEVKRFLQANGIACKENKNIKVREQ